MKVYEMLNSDDKELRRLAEEIVSQYDQVELNELIDYYLKLGPKGKLPKRIKRIVAKEIYKRTISTA